MVNVNGVVKSPKPQILTAGIGVFKQNAQNIESSACRRANAVGSPPRSSIDDSFCYDVSVRLSVRLSVTEVHWRITAK